MQRLAPLALLAALAASPGRAEPPACRATLSGAVEAKFACTVVVAADEEGKVFFILRATGPVAGVPASSPGSFELPAPPAVRTYALADLGPGMASVAAEGGTLYTAAKTSSTRGEVTLDLTSVKRDRSRKSAWIVRGTYRARLLPAGGLKQGDVVVDARF